MTLDKLSGFLLVTFTLISFLYCTRVLAEETGHKFFSNLAYWLARTGWVYILFSSCYFIIKWVI